MILHSVCRKSSARKRRRRTTARTGAGNLLKGLRKRNVKTLSHMWGVHQAAVTSVWPDYLERVEEFPYTAAAGMGCRCRRESPVHGNLLVDLGTETLGVYKELQRDMAATAAPELAPVSPSSEEELGAAGHRGRIGVNGNCHASSRAPTKLSSLFRTPACRLFDSGLGEPGRGGRDSNATQHSLGGILLPVSLARGSA